MLPDDSVGIEVKLEKPDELLWDAIKVGQRVERAKSWRDGLRSAALVVQIRRDKLEDSAAYMLWPAATTDGSTWAKPISAYRHDWYRSLCGGKVFVHARYRDTCRLLARSVALPVVPRSCTRSALLPCPDHRSRPYPPRRTRVAAGHGVNDHHQLRRRIDECDVKAQYALVVVSPTREHRPTRGPDREDAIRPVRAEAHLGLRLGCRQSGANLLSALGN